MSLEDSIRQIVEELLKGMDKNNNHSSNGAFPLETSAIID